MDPNIWQLGNNNTEECVLSGSPKWNIKINEWQDDKRFEKK